MLARASYGRFDAGELLGRGGMGEVRIARDRRVDRDVAIKVLRGTAHPDAVARFLREARVQARLDHPSVVPVYDVGVDEGGVPYFAMKHVTGVTLERVIAAHANGSPTGLAERWPLRHLLARFVEVCLAIELAHTRGIVHRDLKPANIMLGDFGEVYVLDWGIASISDEPVARVDDDWAALVATDTATGALIGTPGYMAPEQIEGQVEPRTDVFALGLILYELLALQPALPRGADAFEATVDAPCHRPSRKVLDVPPELDNICARATANDPADRHGSARALASEVLAYLDGHRDLEHRRELIAEHTRKAEEALAKGDDAGAMRQVGCVLALDQHDHVARTVFHRIFAEPARVEPAKVRDTREAERLRAIRQHVRMSQRIYLVFLALIPLAALIQLTAPIPALVLGCGLLGLVAGTEYVKRHPTAVEHWIRVVLVVHGMLFIVVGQVVGPFQIVPMLGMISLALLVVHPGARRQGWIIVAHMVIVTLPIALELCGVTASTFAFANGSLTVRLQTPNLTEGEMTAAIVGSVLLLQLAVGAVLVRQRRAQERSRDLLQLQRWRLEQLLPETVNPMVSSTTPTRRSAALARASAGTGAPGGRSSRD